MFRVVSLCVDDGAPVVGAGADVGALHFDQQRLAVRHPLAHVLRVGRVEVAHLRAEHTALRAEHTAWCSVRGTRTH